MHLKSSWNNWASSWVRRLVEQPCPTWCPLLPCTQSFGGSFPADPNQSIKSTNEKTQPSALLFPTPPQHSQAHASLKVTQRGNPEKFPRNLIFPAFCVQRTMSCTWKYIRKWMRTYTSIPLQQTWVKSWNVFVALNIGAIGQLSIFPTVICFIEAGFDP